MEAFKPLGEMGKATMSTNRKINQLRDLGEEIADWAADEIEQLRSITEPLADLAVDWYVTIDLQAGHYFLELRPRDFNDDPAFNCSGPDLPSALNEAARIIMES